MELSPAIGAHSDCDENDTDILKESGICWKIDN